MDTLTELGVDVSKLVVSGNAHLIMPYHLEIERVVERFLGKNALGTTKRGIGPAYGDKAARIGLRVQDLFDPKIFREKLDVVLKEKNVVLAKVYGRLPLRADEIVASYMAYADRLRPHLADTSKLLYDGLRAGKHVMLEGAQGTLLDLDHGTYPFVTSSNPVAGYALASAGVGPSWVDRVIGVTKAYVTRVGAGPFPTEDAGEVGQTLVQRGGEFGTTTGRRRRTGWFDAVILRYAARINGFTELFLTKLDVLSELATIKVCVAYEMDGRRFDDVPPHQSLFHRARPVYEEADGWWEDLGDVRSFGDLPEAARAYVRRLEELVGVRIRVVSVGPAREQSLPVPESGR
jgi:adenylosuccinate synthase